MNKYVALFVAVCLTCSVSCERPTYEHLSGMALGTTYSLTYRMPDTAQASFGDTIKRIVGISFDRINNSLSIYNNHSLLSQLNQNKTQTVDSLLANVFNYAREISQKTNGAFDISASPLFSLWGFGAEPAVANPEDSLQHVMGYVGMDKVHIQDSLLVKADPRVTLNMNAIAKGYSADYLAKQLQSVGITDFLIEVGGEIVIKGVNPEGAPWRIGIDQPIDGNITPGAYIEAVITLTDNALATSGNYRNFYIKDGRKLAHTIDPRTGKPVQHEVLSVTVVAPTCTEADGYATAFMVMGLTKSLAFLEQNPTISAHIIYTQGDQLSTYTSPQLRPHISLNKLNKPS